MTNLFRSILLFCLLLCSVGAYAQTSGEWFMFAEKQESPTANTSEWWVSTDSPLAVKDVNEAGIEILRKLDDTHYIIKASDRGISLSGAFNKVYPARPEWKLSPALLQRMADLSEDETRVFYLNVADIDDFLTQQAALAPAARIVRIHKVSGTVVIETTAGAMKSLLPLGTLRYAGEFSGTPHEEAFVSDMNLIPNRVNAVWEAYPELTGKDILVSIKEQAFREDDIDLIGRTVEAGTEAPNTTNHATEMATIVAGAGNSFIKGKGVAWMARLTSSDFNIVLPDDEETYESLDIYVQNHSYGTYPQSFYGTEARAFDASVIATPELVHVFSSGNSGTTTDTTGRYAGIDSYANITGNFKMAKNILTVGAVNLENVPEQLVSRGPAYDGRVKPELVAYSSFGSSNSAAVVSGIAVLLQQAALDMGDDVPPSDLVRAYLINTANDVAAPQVDFITGYGNVNALRAVEEFKRSQYIRADVTDGGTVTETINLPADAVNLKVALVWNDVPAAANAAQAIVNDLDLRVSNSGQTWLPWVLDDTPDPDLLQQHAVRGEDHLNTIEQVTVDGPVPGTYTLTVAGFDVPEGPQSFSLVYQYERAGSFRWTSPVRTDNFPFDGEAPAYFRWDTNLTGTGTIEMSYDDGATWVTVGENVDLEKGFFLIPQPEGHGRAIARLQTDNLTFPTDTFTIGDRLEARVGFNCADSVMLRWENLDEAMLYRVYNASGAYLDTVAVTTDTFLIFNKAEYDTRMFAVQPVYAGNKDGLTNPSYDYSFQGVDCYISTLIPRTLPGEGRPLILKLGTTYGINSVTFERENRDGTYTPVETINTFAGDSVIFLDTDPLDGPNYYRAVVNFGNGESLDAGPVLGYYLDDIEVLVFPNPVQQGDELTIYTREFEGEYGSVSIFNSSGQLVFKEPIITSVKIVPMERFVPGLYLYLVEVDGTRKTGRLLVD
ncbi:MAG: S8 family serine peptidase [Cyclobacteriaceae bacterium]